MFIIIKGNKEMNLFLKPEWLFIFGLAQKRNKKPKAYFSLHPSYSQKAKTKERFPQFFGTFLSY